MSGLMIAGGAISAYGQLRQGMAAKKAAEFNAKVLAEKIKEIQFKAEITADKIRKKKRRVKGIQTVRYAAAGVKIEGTPLEVLADTATEFEQDLAMVDYNKRLAIAGIRMGIEEQQIAAEEAIAAATISAAGTMLGAAASAGYLQRRPSYGDWSSREPYGYWQTRREPSYS